MSEWKTDRVRTCPRCGDIDICYSISGSLQNPTILLVMGLNGQGVMWDREFIDLLVRRGFAVVAFDNRDVGLSSKMDHVPSMSILRTLLPRGLWGPIAYSLDDMAEDAAALLDVIGVQNAHWIGVSMGAMICQIAAIRWPHRVRSLTSIMSSTGNPDVPRAGLAVTRHFLKAPKSQSTEDVVAFRLWFNETVTFNGVPLERSFCERKIRLSWERSRYYTGAARQIVAISAASSRDSKLSQLSIPTLVVHGKQDVLVPPINGYHTASVIPGARLVMFDNMSHGITPSLWEPLADEITMHCRQ